MTDSEIQFERFCLNSGISFVRIPTSNTKSPDYTIKLGDFDAVVEVKEISSNPEEKRLLALPLELWGESECTYYGGPPGERVRKKISDSSRQLKALLQDLRPCLLVIANLTEYPEITDDYAIAAAMFGYEYALISPEAAPEGGAKILKRWHGHGRKTTIQHNRTLSAIGILSMSELCLRMYHNPYSATPIQTSALDLPAITHMRVQDDPEISFTKWTEESSNTQLRLP